MAPYNEALLDLKKVEAWLVEQGLAGAEIAGTTLARDLSGGRSNVMFWLEVGGQDWVLRRPATVAIERANDGMRREFRILRALDEAASGGGDSPAVSHSNSPTAVPHPRAVALCEDLEVLGCVFYLMEKIDGFMPGGGLPDQFTQDGGYRAQLARALIEALAALHNVAWREVGLGDFGRPDGFHERQVERWGAQLASYQGRDIPQLARAGDWLRRHLPAAERWQPGIMHGDFHLFNVLLRPDPPAEVAAIVDWETATIGDPLLDFVGFCEAWKTMRAAGDWPSYDEMLDWYLELRGGGDGGAGGRPTTTEQQYYGVLYNFRLAVLLEGIYQRSLRDPNRPDQEAIGDRALFNADRCEEIIADPQCMFG